jgi:tetratricopeptide (TPR) repeat protein
MMRKRLFQVALVLVATLAVIGMVGTAAAQDELLAEAKAAADNYEVEKAVALYTKAIESGQLSRQRLMVAYMGRAAARESYAEAYGIKDSELVLAFRDYREARKIEPAALGFLSEGSVLIMLGAYNEAAAQFRIARGLEQPAPHWSLISLARVERIQERYDAAIQYLDEALRLVGMGTMPIYYHRGRALFLQGKYGEAVDSFTKGLVHQPDYGYAFIFRACANARAGNATEALKDMEKGVEVMAQYPESAWDKTPAAQADREDRARDLAIIKAMAAGGASEAERAKLCTLTWDGGERLRTRSPLLNIDDLQIVQLSFPSAPPETMSRTCRGSCDMP